MTKAKPRWDRVRGIVVTADCAFCGEPWEQDFRARAGGRRYCDACKPRRGAVARNVHRLVSGAYAVIRWVRGEDGKYHRRALGVDCETPEGAARLRDRMRDEEAGQRRLPGVDDS